MTASKSPSRKGPSPLSRLLTWLRLRSTSAKRRGEPQRYREGDTRPLAEDVIRQLVAMSPWFAAQIAKGVGPNTMLHVIDWTERVTAHVPLGVDSDEMDNCLQRAITLIGTAHKVRRDGQAAYDLTGIGPTSATLRAALATKGPAGREETARQVETHLLRMGVDPGDLIWHALGLFAPDDPRAGCDLVRPWTP